MKWDILGFYIGLGSGLESTPFSLTICFAFWAMKLMPQIQLGSYWLTNFVVKICTLTLFSAVEWNFPLSCWRISLSSFGLSELFCLSPNIATSIFAVTISSFLFEYFLVRSFLLVTGISSKSSKHRLTKCNGSYCSSSIVSESLDESDGVHGFGAHLN